MAVKHTSDTSTLVQILEDDDKDLMQLITVILLKLNTNLTVIFTDDSNVILYYNNACTCIALCHAATRPLLCLRQHLLAPVSVSNVVAISDSDESDTSHDSDTCDST